MFNQKKQKIEWSILLHDIRSVQNVASIFRLSEVFGVTKIVLSGVTPGPLDRFGRVREDFIKISLDAEKSVEWERLGTGQNEDPDSFENLKKYIEDFKKEGGVVLALEQNQESLDYRKYSIDENKKYLVLPGREREGFDENVLKLCDVVLEIPQFGKKESLNIFSAVSILVSRLFG
jgi:tRNA G18 (ribose-2'-O)-methylase SpoU